MGIARTVSGKPVPNMPLMSLEGAEALELYLAGIGHNVDSINKQFVLLQRALAELLRELDACPREWDGLRQIDPSRTSHSSRDD
jgi:hypothetical protein